MMAFGAMIDGPNKENVKAIINSGLPSICQILIDTNDSLSNSASHTLTKISEIFPETIINHNEL